MVALRTFNPIKVLFLQNPVIHCFWQCFAFQSYQGSIFTKLKSDLTGQVKSFNPIKVLFLLYKRSLKVGFMTSFNPIKVLFLHNNYYNSTSNNDFQSYQGSIFTIDEYAHGMGSTFSFQSYQGSIFTSIFGYQSPQIIQLSILSRFYFYTFYNINIFQSHFLSILSRFYFYLLWQSAILQPMCFQSYQGSIFTHFFAVLRQLPWLSILSRFYFYMVISISYFSVRFTFNPIKVLFLPCKSGNFSCNHRCTFNPIKVLFLLYCLVNWLGCAVLSILSRFYFYNYWYWADLRLWVSFNPIKVLFLLQVLETLHMHHCSFNPIKVLFLPERFAPFEILFTLSILSRFYFYYLGE